MSKDNEEGNAPLSEFEEELKDAELEFLFVVLNSNKTTIREEEGEIPYCPCKALIRALIERAILDLSDYRSSTIWREAKNWFTARSDSLFSFNWCLNEINMLSMRGNILKQVNILSNRSRDKCVRKIQKSSQRRRELTLKGKAPLGS